MSGGRDRARLPFGVAVAVSVLFQMNSWAGTGKCSVRAADSIVAARFSECSSKKLISYLHNNIVTPYSFQCAKRIAETCKAEGCDRAATPEAKARCEGRYVDVLSRCEDELDGAAVMAKCKDTKTWPVAAIPATGTSEPRSPTAVAEAPPARVPARVPAILVPRENGSPVGGTTWNEVEGMPEHMEEVIVPAQSSSALHGTARTSRAEPRRRLRFRR